MKVIKYWGRYGNAHVEKEGAVRAIKNCNEKLLLAGHQLKIPATIREIKPGEVWWAKPEEKYVWYMDYYLPDGTQDVLAVREEVEV